MNYFAHGIRFLDRPEFLVGSAVPDMLSVSDRKSRVRRRAIERELPRLSGTDREVALGVLQHLHDDQWFHSTPGFYTATGAMGTLFRDFLGPDENWHCGFLGHIVVELLIDSTLIEDDPAALERYYLAFAEIDPRRIQKVVGELATQPPELLSRFLELFADERFLADYPDDEKLLFRLNQVMRRVQLRALPKETTQVLQAGRRLVRHHLPALLPETIFWQADACHVGPETAVDSTALPKS